MGRFTALRVCIKVLSEQSEGKEGRRLIIFFRQRTRGCLEKDFLNAKRIMSYSKHQLILNQSYVLGARSIRDLNP